MDVKPVEGDVLYKSDFMTELTDFRGTKTDRTWDYLQFFLDEAARRDLEVTVSTTIFPAGLTATRQGPVFRDAAFDGRTCIEYMPDGTLLDIRDDKAINVAFLNPAMPENQEWALRFIREARLLPLPRRHGRLLGVLPQGVRTLPRPRSRAFPPRTYSPTTREGNRIPGKYYKPWWEYRAKVVRDFIARVRAAVDELQPDVRLEYWAGSWLHAIYANGQNWGSPRSTFSDEYLDTWATPGYKEAGFADLLDVFITGTYLERVWGADDNESIEYGLNRSLRDVAGDCTVYGSLYAQNYLDQFDDAVYLCLKKTKGVMVFDIVQVIEHDLWDSIKRGIDRAEAEIANEGK